MKQTKPFVPEWRRRPVAGLCKLLVGIAVALWSSVGAAAEPEAASASHLQQLLAGQPPRDLDDLRLLEHRIAELTPKLMRSTVAVRVGPAQGSGVVVSEDGYVLTAAHVIGRPGRPATLIFADGRRARGVTLGANRTIDSGLIRITSDGTWPHLEMGDSSRLQPGQWVLGTGHPGGLQEGRPPVLRLGRVLATDPSVIVTDCTLVSGDSGGPLFDLDGRVVGIHSRIGSPLTVNIHVPVKTYRDTWDRLADGELWGRMPGEEPFIGVEGDPDSKAAKIVNVLPGTPAERAGIQAGDVIVEFDGKEVDSFERLAELVAKKDPGDHVRVKVRREDKTVNLTVVIGRRGDR